jgi:hypothetical protein
MKQATWLLMAAWLCSGCGALSQMRQQMSNMSDTTQQMGHTTDEMNQRTALLQREQRQGVAQQTRGKALDDLMRDSALELKMKDAAVYFQSFEFQLWENILDDDEQNRQALLATGAEEFLLTFRGVMDGKYSDPDPASKDGRMRSLLAFGATADQMNELQISASKRPRTGFKAVSMLDLITDALAAKPALERNPGADFPAYVGKVLFYEDEAAYFLQIRHNIMAAMVVDKLAPMSQMSLGEKLSMILAALKIKKSWKAKLERVNAVELSEMTRFLGDAEKARASLEGTGRKASLNSRIAHLLERVQLVEDPRADESKSIATADFEAKLREFLGRR